MCSGLILIPHKHFLLIDRFSQRQERWVQEEDELVDYFIEALVGR